MNNQPEFQHGGYLPLSQYVADIKRFRTKSRWRLPLNLGDRWQLLLLSVMARLSWFAPLLHVKHAYPWGPAYTLLIQYLRKKLVVDEVSVRTLKHPGFFSFYAERRIMKGSKQWKISGHGVSRDRETALSKTLGEILERTISGLGDENRDITFSSPKQLLTAGVPIIYPPRYHRYLPIQIAAHATKLKHDPSESIEWVAGLNLITQQSTLIPKHLTSWFLGNRIYKRLLQHPTSNGSGAYFTKDGAVLRALLEVVQRDAIMTHWLTKTTPARIAVQSLPQPLQHMVRDSERIGLSIYILDITALPIPTVCVVAISRQSAKPQVVLSAAAALRVVDAIGDALEELVNIIGIINEAEKDGDAEVITTAEVQPFTSKLTARTRQLYWRGEERVRELDWFLSGPPMLLVEVSKRDLANEALEATNLQTCLTVLKNQGEDYYPVVYNPRNSLQDDLGFYVAQVFIPKAFPLYLLEYCGTFDSDRLSDFAKAKGIASWTLNTQPHMFS